MTVAPMRLLLTFSENLLPAFSRLTLLDPTMQPVGIGPLRVDPADARVLQASIDGVLAAGRYTVRWRFVGDDGHPVNGEYVFTVDGRMTPAVAEPALAPTGAMNGRDPTPPTLPVASGQSWLIPRTEGSSTEGTETFGVSSPAYVAIRAVQFLSVVLLIGLLTMQLVVLPRIARLDPDVKAFLVEAHASSSVWARRALWAFGVATLARLVAQHAALFGLHTHWSSATLGALLMHSPWGSAWMLAVAAAGLGFVAVRRHAGLERMNPALLAVATVGMVLTLSMSGHSSAAVYRTLEVALDMLHVLGAGGWVGSLAVLVVVGLPATAIIPMGQRHAVIARVVAAFSPVALGCALALAVTGVFAAWRRLMTLPALWQSPYGQTLLLKLLMLSLVAVIGAFNWRYVLPKLGDASATVRLRWSATVELTVAVLVLIVTAALVATPLPVAAISRLP